MNITGAVDPPDPCSDIQTNVCNTEVDCDNTTSTILGPNGFPISSCENPVYSPSDNPGCGNKGEIPGGRIDGSSGSMGNDRTCTVIRYYEKNNDPRYHGNDTDERKK